MRKTATPTLHPRTWHRTSPCPRCGTRKPRFERYARAYGLYGRLTFWIAKCRECHHSILLLTPGNTIKDAICEWNRILNETKGIR